MTSIKDIAKAAGVSPGTVSLAMHGSTSIREETRRRVLAAAEQLHYVPNTAAQSLVTRKRLVVGVVRCVSRLDESPTAFDATVDTYLSDMLLTIERESVRSGYSLMVDWMAKDDPELPVLCSGQKTDGVLIVGGLLPKDIDKKLKNAQIPAVLVGSRSELLDSVDADSEAGIAEAAELLIRRGHKRIAFLNGPEESTSSNRKLQGYLSAMEAHHLPIITANGPFSGQGGFDAMRVLWERGERPTALIAAADCMAIGALHYLAAQNIRCPQDISVVGFEDGLLPEYFLPRLTSISVRKQEIAKAACRLLTERLANPDKVPESVLISPLLVERDSIMNYRE